MKLKRLDGSMPKPAGKIDVSLKCDDEISRQALLTKRGTEYLRRPGRNGSGRAQRDRTLGPGQRSPRQADKAQRKTVHRKRMYVQLKAKHNDRSTKTRDAQSCIWMDTQSRGRKLGTCSALEAISGCASLNPKGGQANRGLPKHGYGGSPDLVCVVCPI